MSGGVAVEPSGGEKREADGFRIGYALSAKKAQSFLRQELLDACRELNVFFLPIDRSKKLVDAGDFDAILHKDTSIEWAKQMEEYLKLHPTCILIDPPKHIVPLRNRVSMLQCVDQSLLSALKSSAPSMTLQVPRQICVVQGEDMQEALDKSRMKFPLVAKPLVADGSAESHKMFQVLNSTGLQKLRPPLVIQEFINHGGVIFKVYVVGDSAICTPRKSLQDCQEGDLCDPAGLIAFCQVSNLQQKPDGEDQNPRQSTESVSSLPALDSEVELSSVELPDASFINDLSSLLRDKLELTLFNYDLIQDTRTRVYYIVDINYFPGFAKMPRYLSVLTRYFAGLTKPSSKHS